MLTYVQEDTGVLQRAGIITVAGLGGIVAGYRGGYVRKAAFAGVGMATAAAICYPNQAVDMSSRNWEKAKAAAMDMWKDVAGSLMRFCSHRIESASLVIAINTRWHSGDSSSGTVHTCGFTWEHSWVTFN